MEFRRIKEVLGRIQFPEAVGLVQDMPHEIKGMSFDELNLVMHGEPESVFSTLKERITELPHELNFVVATEMHEAPNTYHVKVSLAGPYTGKIFTLDLAKTQNFVELTERVQ